MNQVNTGYRHRPAYWLLNCVVLLTGTLSARGQSDTSRLPKIEFRDTVLERNLNAFAGQNREQIIEVSMRTQDSVRMYTITGVYNLRTLDDMASCRYMAWGQWYGRTVVVSGDSTLSQCCIVTRPATLDRLIDYAQGPLGQKRMTAKERWVLTARGVVEVLGECVTVCDAPKWQFGVKNTREEWLSTKDGYYPRDIIVPGTYR